MLHLKSSPIRAALIVPAGPGGDDCLDFRQLCQSSRDMERFAPSGEAGGLAAGSQETAEFRRYLEALRRSRLLIFAIVVPLTASVLAVSLLLPATYRASATIVLGGAGVSRAGGNPDLVRRELETVEQLVTTRTVLAAAATRLRDESVDTLEEKVSASAAGEANLVRVTAEDGDAAGAALIANAVADAFLAERATAERRALAAARRTLLERIDRLQGSPGSRDEIAALRDGLRGLATTEASLRAELTLAERARAPEDPDSPRILQNTLFALFGFAFIAVLAALARDQIAPRVRNARELSRLIGAPLLMEMPAPRPSSKLRREQPELAAYELLQETVRSLLPPGELRAVLVASPRHDAAAAQVAAGLAGALARAEERTVLVDGSSDQTASRDPRPPVSDLLRGQTARTDGVDDLFARAEQRENLLAFSYDTDAALGSPSRIEALVEALAERDVGFLVLSGPPLASRDGLLLPHLLDGLLLLCRPQRVTRDDANRLRELLDASGANVLGILSMGARQVVPYEVARSAGVLEPGSHV
jgi:capsular polysaccharide biosynthesis protein